MSTKQSYRRPSGRSSGYRGSKSSGYCRPQVSPTYCTVNNYGASSSDSQAVVPLKEANLWYSFYLNIVYGFKSENKNIKVHYSIADDSDNPLDQYMDDPPVFYSLIGNIYASGTDFNDDSNTGEKIPVQVTAEFNILICADPDFDCEMLRDEVQSFIFANASPKMHSNFGYCLGGPDNTFDIDIHSLKSCGDHSGQMQFTDVGKNMTLVDDHESRSTFNKANLLIDATTMPFAHEWVNKSLCNQVKTIIHDDDD